MSDAPLLSIEALIEDSIALDAAAKRAGITLTQARAMCVAFASLPITQVERIVLGAYDRHVKTINAMTRRGR